MTELLAVSESRSASNLKCESTLFDRFELRPCGQ